MRKLILLLCILSLFTSIADAQLWKLRRYEVTAGIGTTQFFGDIGGFSKGENLLGLKDITFRHTRFNINTSFKYRISKDFSVRMNLTFGNFHSTDERGSNVERGFDSRTLFFEPALVAEYYIIRNKSENSFLMLKDDKNYSHSILALLDIYVFAGFGGLSYNVNPNDLLLPRMSATKGFAPVIPAGAGANFAYSGHYSFGIELGGRYCFSDNIDGYTSEYSKSNDVYYFLTFNFIYKIKTGENGLPSF